VQLHQIGFGCIDPLRPAGWHQRRRVNDWVARSEQLTKRGGELGADAAHCLGPLGSGPLHRPITRCCHIHQHLRDDARAAQGVMDAIGSAGGATIDIRIVELESVQRAGKYSNSTSNV